VSPALEALESLQMQCNAICPAVLERFPRCFVWKA